MRRLVVRGMGFLAVTLAGVLVLLPNASAALVTYTDRASFNAAAPGLPVEDFEEGIVDPSDIVTFLEPLDSTTNNSVFSPNDILAGIRFTVKDNNPEADDLALTGAGALNQASKVLLNNAFDDVLQVNMTTGKRAIGLDIVTAALSQVVTVEVFGASDIMLGIAMVNALSDGTLTFLGFTSDVDILKLTLDDDRDSDDVVGIDNVAFEASTIPEPSTMLLLGSGLAGLGLIRRRKKTG